MLYYKLDMTGNNTGEVIDSSYSDGQYWLYDQKLGYYVAASYDSLVHMLKLCPGRPHGKLMKFKG